MGEIRQAGDLRATDLARPLPRLGDWPRPWWRSGDGDLCPDSFAAVMIVRTPPGGGGLHDAHPTATRRVPIQRGNGRAQTFFSDADYALYRDLLAASCRAAEVDIWAWVLMPNHVHLILWPMPNFTLSEILKRRKRHTARQANLILGRTGETFWQHESYDHWIRNDEEKSRIRRYIRNNPVTAKLCQSPEEWTWSSAYLPKITGSGLPAPDTAACQSALPRGGAQK